MKYVRTLRKATNHDKTFGHAKYYPITIADGDGMEAGAAAHELSDPAPQEVAAVLGEPGHPNFNSVSSFRFRWN